MEIVSGNDAGPSTIVLGPAQSVGACLPSSGSALTADLHRPKAAGVWVLDVLELHEGDKSTGLRLPEEVRKPQVLKDVEDQEVLARLTAL